MNTQRLSEITAQAKAAARSLRTYGYIKRNKLPRVSVFEHKWLCDHEPKVAALTRSFDYDDNEYVNDSGLYRVPGTNQLCTRNIDPARRPIIREIWVGARSMGCVGEDDLPEGFQVSQMEQEDHVELTDMVTMTYDDPLGWEAWVEAELDRRIAASRGKRWVNNHIIRRVFRRALMMELPMMRRVRGERSEPAKCMIHDPETGEYRPLRIGDSITVAHGSNEDLDAVFLDEPADPRSEDDARIRELTRDRVNPNSDFEQEMLNDPEMAIASDKDEFYDNELHLRRVANYLAEQMVARKPSLGELTPALREYAYRRIKAGHDELRSGEDRKVVSGRWLQPSDLWAEQERHLRTLERHLQTHRGRRKRPAPVDWDAIRA